MVIKRELKVRNEEVLWSYMDELLLCNQLNLGHRHFQICLLTIVRLVCFECDLCVEIGNPARLSSLLRDYHYSTNI